MRTEQMRTEVEFATIEEALEEIVAGRMVVVVDDENRENEGDLVMAAELVTPDDINFMATHARGWICLTLTPERCDELGLELMTAKNETPHETPFTVTIEAREGVTTGISAADRAHTIRTAVDPAKGADDIVKGGHVNPLKARAGGVLERTGHTEAGVDLARLAGLTPAAVICEVMNEDGTMARVGDLAAYCHKHRLKMITIADLIAYRRRHDRLVERVVSTALPTGFGEFEVVGYRSLVDDKHHVALVKGDVNSQFSFLPSVLLGATVAAAFAAIISIPVLRLSGIQAGISTLAVLVIVQVVAVNWTAMTGGGSSALIGVPATTTAGNALLSAIVAIAVAFLYQTSRRGRRLRASREDAPAAAAIGIGIRAERRIAFIISAFIVGAGGALWAHFVVVFSPDSFYFATTFITIAMLVIGGIGTLTGAVGGVVLVVWLQEGLRRLESGVDVGPFTVHSGPGVSELVLASIMLAVLLLRPRGVFGGQEVSWPGLRRRRRVDAAGSPSDGSDSGDPAQGTAYAAASSR